MLSYFARHRTAANLLLVALIVAGLAAAPNMRAQFFPDIVIEEIDVDVAWPGAGAEDVDSAITQPLEQALLGVEGVEETEARSREGVSSIEVEFEPGWDMSRAAEDVAQAVDGIDTLPNEAEQPRISRGGWRDRVTDVIITGPVGVDQLGRFADELVRRLFEAGVTRTTIRGLSDPETLVEVPSLSLIRHRITLREIADAIAGEAQTDPAGDVGGGSRVRTGTAKRSADEIAGIVLRSNPDGSNLTVGDVATVRTLGIDRQRAYFVGDNPAISLRVDRSEKGDAIAIQRQVEEIAAEMQPTLPEGVVIDLIRTRAEQITGRLQILLDNGLVGLGLVVTLLFLFLNARTAFWVAAGIPVAMTAAIAAMYAGGLTLNMISLFALIITLGIVVDDAIVVGEHADFRAGRLGESPIEAAENAANRMFLPVLSATLTTVIAFFALVAVGGRFGEMIADIPYTVIAVLLASLVECFLILPNHMAHAIRHSAKQHWYDWPSRQVNRGFRWVRDRLFRPMIAGVIVLRYPVIAGMIVILASQAALFIRGDVVWRFWSSPEQGSVSGNFAMVPGATREDTVEMMRMVQRTVEELGAEYQERHGRNPIDYVVAEIGGTTGRGLAGEDAKDQDLLGSIAIELIDADLRPYSSYAFVGELQERVPPHPQLETLSFRGWRGGPGGDALDVEISGADAPTLKAAAEALKARAAQFPEVSGLEDNLSYDKDELILDLTPQGQALGFTIDELSSTLRSRLNGIEAATYPEGPRSAAIRVELPEEELTADFLQRMFLRAPEGAYVPLSDIVSVETRQGFSTVRRENGRRVVSVSGDISDDDAARAAAIGDALRADILPAIEAEYGVATRMSGLAEQEREFLGDAATGLILCLTGIFIVLTWIFSSWTRPLVVMAIIPFGLVGTIWGHYLWGVPITMFSIVGLIGMVGIIINDSIVLVGTIDEYARDRGMIPAIIDGAADRLRPVLLTTLTTVLGLAPLLYETSQQAQFLKPTVITLCYGLGFGMVLVLLLVPALLAAQRDVAQATASVRRALARGGPARTATGLAIVAAVAALAVSFGPVVLSGGASLGRFLGADLPLPPVLVALALLSVLLTLALAAIYAAAGLFGRLRG